MTNYIQIIQTTLCFLDSKVLNFSVMVPQIASVFVAHLTAHLNETECEEGFEDEVLDARVRAFNFQVKVKCKGSEEPVYALFTVDGNNVNTG